MQTLGRRLFSIIGASADRDQLKEVRTTYSLGGGDIPQQDTPAYKGRATTLTIDVEAKGQTYTLMQTPSAWLSATATGIRQPSIKRAYRALLSAPDR
jgi:hypothetical protein